MLDFFFTQVAYADGIDNFIQNVNRLILNPLIKLLFALALAFFLWGMSQFVLNAENDEARETGKRHMLWGIVGMTIMFSVWGLMYLVLDTFQIEGINPRTGDVNLNNYNPPYPQTGN